MDNFNIHKYLKKEYLSESVDDESAEYYFDYLNKLRDSGVTNMFGAGSYLQAVFGLDKRTAREILSKWMKSMNEDRKAKEYIKSIEDEDEREEERKRMFDNPEDLDEVELTQDFGELDEDHTKRENNQLKKISKQLKKSVKSHAKQSKIIDKIVKEVLKESDSNYPDFDLNKNIRYKDTSISSGMWRYTGQEQGGAGVYRNLNNGQILAFDRSDFDIFKNNLSSHFDFSESLNEATFEDEIARLEDTMYTERRDTRIFIHPLDKPDAFRPSGNYVVVDGNNVTSVQGYNTGPISDLADKYGLDDEDSMTMGKTNARGRVSLLSSNILRDAIKAIEDSRDAEAKAQSDYYGSKPKTGRIGYGLSSQPRMKNEALDFEDVMYLRDDKKDLEDRIAQLYRDMEQEAEPEGGEVADRYGSMLNKLEDKLYRVKKQINQYDMNEGVNEGASKEDQLKVAKAAFDKAEQDGDIKGQELALAAIDLINDMNEELNERVVYDNETQLLKARIAADDFMRIYRSEFRRMFTNFGKEAEAEFKKIVKDKFSRLQEGSCGYTPDGKSRNKPASSDLIKLKEKLEQVNEKLCKKGEAYRKRRMAAGEKSSAYLSGRAVKVCKGQMSGKKKKK